MTIADWLKNTTKVLEDASIPTARLDAEVLLTDALKKDRAWIHAHQEYVLQGATLQRLEEWFERRMKHEPIAYIRGKQEFYGRDFYVSPDTLTPRPETETMVELALELVNSGQLTVDSELQITDVGTGSGCIVITTALELSKVSDINYQLSYLGLDISKPALKIARENAKKLSADVEFKHFDLVNNDLSSTLKPQASHLILANLPYVPAHFSINLAATHEPELAIFGGEDGLTYYRTLFEKVREVEMILTESLPPQHEQLKAIAKNHGYRLLTSVDLIQVFKKSK